MSSYKMKSVGLTILRLGLALVFLWFGTQQIFHAENWVTFVPGWAQFSFLTAKQLVLINGAAEIVGGILLIGNFFTRIVALLLALHLFGIALSFGATPTGVRDFGLAFATLALFFIGPRLD